MARRGQDDKGVIVIAPAAPSCRRGRESRVSGDHPRCATRRGPVGFAVVIPEL
jgi:hypothetical protein